MNQTIADEKRIADVENDTDEENEEDEFEEVYGTVTRRTVQLTMAGGGDHWWNYILEFEANGEYQVYIENNTGRHAQPGDLLFRDSSVRLVHPVDIDRIELGDDDIWACEEMFFSD